MKSFRWFALCALALIFAGVCFADDPPVTDVQVIRPLAGGITVNTHVQNGVMTATVLTGYPVMFTRALASTLAWSVETSTDASNVYLDIVSTESAQGGSKTCCEQSCDDGHSYHLSVLAGDCIFSGSGCQVCTYTCTSGWVNCPVGTKLVARD